MTTPSPETKPHKRRRRKVTKLQPATRACGHPLAYPWPYIWAAFSDGSTFGFSARAIERGGLCPHCCVMSMADEGLVDVETHDESLRLITDCAVHEPGDDIFADRLFQRFDFLTARTSLPISWHTVAGAC